MASRAAIFDIALRWVANSIGSGSKQWHQDSFAAKRNRQEISGRMLETADTEVRHVCSVVGITTFRERDCKWGVYDRWSDWTAWYGCSLNTEYQLLGSCGQGRVDCLRPAPSLATYNWLLLKMRCGTWWIWCVRMTLMFLLLCLAHSWSSSAGFPCS